MKLDGLPSTVTTPPAVTLTFDLMNMSQAQVHTWPYFGEISSKIYEDIPFIQYIMVTACCDLLWSSTFDPKSNQQSTNPYIISVTKIWRNSFIVFFWDTVFTRFSGCTDSLTHTRTDRPEYSMPPTQCFWPKCGNKLQLPHHGYHQVSLQDHTGNTITCKILRQSVYNGHL